MATIISDYRNVVKRLLLFQIIKFGEIISIISVVALQKSYLQINVTMWLLLFQIVNFGKMTAIISDFSILVK